MKKRLTFITASLVFLMLLAAPGVFAGGGSQQGRQSSGSAAVPADNFNPTGVRIVKEPVTKHYLLRRPPHINDPNTMITFQKYEEMSGVKVNWEVVAADGFNERINLLMASNTMPDAIMKGVPDVTKSAADGSIVDLTDLIDKYSVGLKGLYNQYPAAMAAAKAPDGKIYQMPTINTIEANRTGHRNLWINKKWMDRLGITAMPTTIDEYLNILRQFRDKDANGNGNPSDELPFTVDYSSNRHPGIGAFYGSWGIAPNLGYNVFIRNDKVEMLYTSDEYREVLQFMNTMWKERLLDPGVFTQTTDVSLSKFNSNISGGFALSSADLWSTTAIDYAPIPPPKAKPNVTTIIGLNPEYGGGAAVITRADKNPEITMRWMDWFYTDEGSRFIGAQSPLLEGVASKKVSSDFWDYSDAILNSPKGAAMAVGDVCPLPGGMFPYWRNVNNSSYIYDEKIRSSVPTYQQYYQKTPAYAYPVFSVQDSEKVNDIRRDLDVYTNECQAKFITGELGFDRWSEYVATCERMNIKELQRLFQVAYDRMK